MIIIKAGVGEVAGLQEPTGAVAGVKAAEQTQRKQQEQIPKNLSMFMVALLPDFYSVIITK